MSGYSLIQEDDTPQAGDIPSMKNIYESTYWNNVRQEELGRSTNLWNQAQTPTTSGVVPRPAYADMFVPLTPPFQPSSVPPAGALSDSLTGEQATQEQMRHNNMQPFFRGSATQNVEAFATSPYLENSTGRGELFKHKQETDCFFEPTPYMGNVCGMANSTDFYRSHLQAPKARNNDFPIEQVRVAPGLAQGYNALGEGGFQQTRTLDYIKPKTVDELRPLSRPKTSFQIPTQGPKGSKVQNRGMEGDFSKNRPDTYYEQTQEQWLRTTGANTKQVDIPEFIVKPTARVDTHAEYQGIARADAQPGKGSNDDYGRSSVIVYTNARDETQKRTVLTNLTSIVKTVVAPFVDILRRTPKEYTIDSARTFGNMSAQIPEKPTLYDPVNHIMKTTIKETTIHDTTILNPHGNNKGWVQGDDTARTTVRQTTASEDTYRNVNSHVYKTVVINPEMVAKKTVRETTEDNNNQKGYVGGDTTHRRGAYSHIEVQVYDTQKQYISENQHTGTAGSGAQYYPTSYEADYNAEIDGTREMMNIKAGNTPNAKGANRGLDGKDLDLEVKKLESDRVNTRDTVVEKIYQPTARAIEQCEVSKHPQKACMNENENRLDPSLLSNLKDNPYNLSINPILG